MSIKGDFDTLWSNYPKGFSHNPALSDVEDKERIANLNITLRQTIGKHVNNSAYKNLCAIRLSYSLNRSGLKIPKQTPLKWYKADFSVVEGGDGFYYGHGVVEMFHYISEKYGKPDIEIPGPFGIWKNGIISQDPGALISVTVPPGFKSKKGIIIFLVSIWKDAQGHASLWDGEKCSDNSYFEFADRVMLWEVKPKIFSRSVRIHNLNDAIRMIARPIGQGSGQ
jgi:hypothetical protein